MMAKTFIVDDHKIFRNGLKLLLKEIPGVEIIGEASNGKEFIEKIKNNIPSIVFMDIKMPLMNGIEATKKALNIYPSINIIALSMFNDYEYLEEILDAGAVGYMLKNIGKADLENAINNIKEGRGYFCDNMIMVATKKVKKIKEDNEKQKIIKKLSKRELEVLELICKGLSTKDIADTLNVSPRTIDGHRNNMRKKTGFNNTTALVSFAINNNIVNI